MTIVYSYIWLLHVVRHDPESSNIPAMDFFHVDWRGKVSITKHAKAQEWVSHLFGEEDPSDLYRDVGEGVSYTSNDNVLEDRSALDEWGLLFL